MLLQCIKHTVQLVLDTSKKEMKTLAFCPVISICSNFMYTMLLGKLYQQSLIIRYFCSLNGTAFRNGSQMFLKIKKRLKGNYLLQELVTLLR